MITKEMSIFEALSKHPEARGVFKKHNMHCLDCMGAIAESIEEGARMHGIDLKALLKELNDLLQDE
ncbi:MAG: DUF1858 domain-containing protein [Clostridia bacterium]|nr:DUF1858 domain-containing protein [Clostridia bacterium]